MRAKIIEVQRFVEFLDRDWKTPLTRDNMSFETMMINLEYVAWVRRWNVGSGVEMSDISMVDHGKTFTVDKTYEEMRELLRG